jgi:peroxiredoxin
MPQVQAGDRLTDFTLKDQHNEELTLSALRGRRVLLSFHPLAFTPVCTRQMQALEAAWDRLSALDTVPLGISVDAWPSKHAWGNEIGLKKLRILSDFWPHGGVAESMGLFRRKEGFSERANVILDESGHVLHVIVYEIPQLPDLDEVLRVIEQAARPGS